MIRFNRIEIVERLDLLNMITSFQFQEKAIDEEHFVKVNEQMFTDGEKICINQERASLRDYLAYLNGEIEIQQVRNYSVAEEIDLKITRCMKLIKSTNWTLPINKKIS